MITCLKTTYQAQLIPIWSDSKFARLFSAKQKIRIFTIFLTFISLKSVGLEFTTDPDAIQLNAELNRSKAMLLESLQSIPLTIHVAVDPSWIDSFPNQSNALAADTETVKSLCARLESPEDWLGSRSWKFSRLILPRSAEGGSSLQLSLQCGLWKILLRQRQLTHSRSFLNHFNFDFGLNKIVSFRRDEPNPHNHLDFENRIASEFVVQSESGRMSCFPAMAALITQHNWKDYLSRCSALPPVYVDASDKFEVFAPKSMDQIGNFTYLMAGPGKGAARAFGHAMLSMKVCTSQSNSCPESDFKEFIFSYNVAESEQADFEAGFGWTLSAQLLLLSSSVIKKFYEASRQHVSFLPLALRSHEKLKLYLMLSEAQREYFGTWNHLFNNCVSHIWRALNASLDPERKFDNERAIPSTPSQLYHSIKNGIGR